MSINQVNNNLNQPIQNARVVPFTQPSLSLQLLLPNKKVLPSNAKLSSEKHYQKAITYNTLVDKFQALLDRMNSPYVSNADINQDYNATFDLCATSVENYEWDAFIDALFTTVSQFIGTNDTQAILDHMQQTPRMLHLIKDANGKSLIEQFIRHLEKKRTAELELASLFRIKHYIEEGDMEIAFSNFDHLSEKTKNILISHLQKANKKLNAEAIFNNPKLLVENCHNSNALDHAISKQSHKFSKPFTFTSAYQLLDTADFNHAEKSVWDIEKVNQLQAFYFLLKSPILDLTAISAQFDKLHGDLKGALSWIVYCACYKPSNVKHTFGEDKIKEDPLFLLICKNDAQKDVVIQLIEHYMSCVKQRESEPDFSRNVFDAIKIYDTEMTIPEGPINCSAAHLLKQPSNNQIGFKVHVAAEYNGIVGAGGLGSVVQGIAHADGKLASRIILPFYKVKGTDNFINSNVKPQSYHFTISYEGMPYQPGGKVHKVFKAVIDGVNCFFIEDDSFIIEKDQNGKAKGPYTYSGTNGEEKAINELRRWAYFCSHAEMLIRHLGAQFVVLNDAQTALIPRIIETRHPEEWQAGKTPAIHLIIHNVICPLYFNWHGGKTALNEIGITDDVYTALFDGIKHADGINTVSPRFSEELQTMTFGSNNEIDYRRDYKIQTMRGAFTGILNGATIGWNPATHPQLKNWRELRLEFSPFTMQSTVQVGNPIDLSYSHDLDVYPQRLIKMREQLKLYALKYLGARINPNLPIFFYIGRYCSGQKGIDKLNVAMQAALNAGAQFICVGPKPDTDDKTATQMVQQLQLLATMKGNVGVCVVADYKRSDGRWHYQQGNTPEGNSPADKEGIPGFEAILRGSADQAFFLSKFEPCGLVQLESHQMCTPTVVTDVGGFHDTVFTEGDLKNGYRIDRKAEWRSTEQDNAIIDMTHKVAKESQQMLLDLYSGSKEKIDRAVHQRRRIGYHAMQASWTKTEDKSPSPIEYYHRAWDQTMNNRAQRGIVKANLSLQKI